MKKRQSKKMFLVFLTGFILVACLYIIGMYFVFDQFVDKRREQLSQIVSSNAALISNLAESEHRRANLSGDQIDLKRIFRVYKSLPSFGRTGEFVLGEKSDDQIIFLVPSRKENRIPLPVPWQSELAEPMRQALNGKTGTIEDIDYIGDKVMASFIPIKELNVGLVAKIDLKEIREPFYTAATIITVACLLMIFTMIFLYGKFIHPMIESIEDYAEKNKETNNTLKEAISKAEEAAHLKSHFLANMSHEIRTPMTSIVGFTDKLIKLEQDKDNLRDLKIIRKNGNHLLSVINDILDFSKIEAGQLETEIITCSLNELVNEVKNLFEIKAMEKGLDLRIDIASDVPDTLLTDPTRLKQILINLVGNAIKFTEKGYVTIIVRKENVHSAKTFLSFKVIDTGIGMTDVQLDRLFKPFSQADTSTTRKYGGTGIGLLISKKLIKILGGQIEVTSSPNRGSTFAFTIDAGDARQAKQLPDVKNRAKSNKPLPSSSTSTLTAEGKAILVAEDSVDIQILMRGLLEGEGAQVTIVNNGQEAVDSFKSDRFFDLIFMDMQMPIKDGYQATKEIRQLNSDIPIVALTASALKEDKDKCLSIGCSEYLSKPLRPRQLKKMLKEVFDQQENPSHSDHQKAS